MVVPCILTINSERMAAYGISSGIDLLAGYEISGLPMNNRDYAHPIVLTIK